jgi:hypothetical protein
MPDYAREALDERGLMDAYRERPEYQQNDYIGWITRAKRPETREKRLAQMLDGHPQVLKRLGFLIQQQLQRGNGLTFKQKTVCTTRS